MADGFEFSELLRLQSRKDGFCGNTYFCECWVYLLLIPAWELELFCSKRNRQGAAELARLAWELELFCSKRNRTGKEVVLLKKTVESLLDFILKLEKLLGGTVFSSGFIWNMAFPRHTK